MEINILYLLLTLVGAYLLGSIPSAVWIGKAFYGVDVREHGSGNAGMTNILRTYGKGPAALTALGDFGKGAIAVLIGRLIFHILGIDNVDGGYAAGFFALIGHLFPLYFGFKGGKGVLTSSGVVFVIHPLIFFVLACIVIPTMFITKIVSLGSLLAAVLFPIATFLFTGFNFDLDLLFSLLISGVVIYMHRANIKRLLSGTENKFSLHKKN